MALKFSTFKHSEDNQIVHRTAPSWDAFVRALSKHRFRPADQKDRDLFSPAEYYEEVGTTRGNDGVIAVNFLVLDIDKATDDALLATCEALEQSGADVLLYTTWQHASDRARTPPLNRYRALVPLSRPVLAEEWGEFWPRACARFIGLDGLSGLDTSCKDASRMYYMPSAPLGTEDVAHVERFNEGSAVALDVEDVLADPEPAGYVRRASPARAPGAPAPAVRAVRVGGRNVHLTSIAGTLRNRGFDETALLAALTSYNAEHCDPPLPDDEVSHIAHSIARKDPGDRGIFKFTEVGNAERMVHRYGERMRYVASWDQWLVWDERRWSAHNTESVLQRFAKRTIRGIAEESKDHGLDKDLAESLRAWAHNCEKHSMLTNMVKLARSEPGVALHHEALDADPYLFNVRNGTVDLRTGALLAHDPVRLITKLAPVTYDPDAMCPTWSRFLLDVMGGDESLVAYLQRAVGYSLTGDVREHALFFLHGHGANGKGTFIDVLLSILGEYATPGAPNLLLASRNERHPAEQADLFGARLVSTPEVEEGRGWAETVVKQLTGGDVIKARRMGENFWAFPPTHKFWVSGNHRPPVRETTDGIWRRMRLIPFTVSYKGRENRELKSQLLTESAGILAWAVAGCLEWQEHGLGEPSRVRAAVEEYRQEQDELGAFFEERCVFEEGAKITRADLWSAYQQWLIMGQQKSQITDRRFADKLRERGITDTKVWTNSTSVRGWLGVRIRTAKDSASSGGLKLIVSR